MLKNKSAPSKSPVAIAIARLSTPRRIVVGAMSDPDNAALHPGGRRPLKEGRQGKSAAPPSATSLAVIPLVSLAVAIVVATSACRVRGRCDSDASLRCTVPHTSPRWLACAFVARPVPPDPISVLFGNGVTAGMVPWTLALHATRKKDEELALAHYRGRCPVAMHEGLGVGRSCLPQFWYPSALARSAMLPDDKVGVTTPVSQIACGAWIESAEGAQWPGGSLFSFAGSSLVSAAMWALVAQRLATLGGTFEPRSASKLLWGCRAATDEGPVAMALSMRLAHAELVAPLVRIAEGGTLADVVRFVARLASYACPGLVSIGLRTSKEGFHVTVVDGTLPSASRVRRAVGALGADETIVRQSTEALEAILSADPRCATAEWITHATIELLVSYVADQDFALLATDAQMRGSLHALATLLCHVGTRPIASRSEEVALLPEMRTRAARLLSAISAECVAVVVDRMYGARAEPAIGDDDGDILHDDSGVGGLVPLGRVLRRHTQTTLDEPTPYEWETATLRTLRRATAAEDLQRAPSLSFDGAHVDQCFSAVAYAAVDELEAALFTAIVPSTLYERLRVLTDAAREAIVERITRSPLREIFVDVGAAVNKVRGARVRISGAPAGSWAGRGHATSSTDASRQSGAAYSLLAAVRSRSTDAVRVALGLDGGACDAPPVFEATQPNAYYLHASNCVFLSIGLLRMPFADDAYDDVSLRSRVGFIIAHELAHATIVSPRKLAPYRALLEYYAVESTREEAFADVIAAEALLSMENTFDGCNRTILHVAQLFCATPGGRSSTTHPTGNARPDRLARTLSEKFGRGCAGG